MNKKTLAQRFDLSLTTVDNWLRQGCPVTRKGRQLHFDPVRVREWLTQRAERVRNPATLTEARTRRETAVALLRELDFRERTGELVAIAIVEDAAIRSAHAVREALRNLPHRCAGLIAAAAPGADQHRIRTLLSDEIDRALQTLNTPPFAQRPARKKARRR